MAKHANRRQLEAGGEDADVSAAPSGAVLSRNFGMVDHGHSRFWPAGHVFDAEQDEALIARLRRAGATFHED